MGKIGKPQKSGKHRKLKPVIGEYDNRNHRSKKLSNLRPDKEDFQEMPQKVKKMMEWKEDKHTGKKPKKRNKFSKDGLAAMETTGEFHIERGMTRPMKPAPVFVQGEGEDDYRFMKRVDRVAEDAILHAKLEDKYKVEITKDADGGSIIQKKRSSRKREKDKERKQKKKQKIIEKKLGIKADFSDRKGTDEVEFGEVAMAPPTLTAKPRKAQPEAGAQQRPGKKSLLLHQILKDSKKSSPVVHTKAPTVATRAVGQSVKRKHLSPAQQRITDQKRQEAIDQYRQIRDKQLKQFTLR